MEIEETSRTFLGNRGAGAHSVTETQFVLRRLNTSLILRGFRDTMSGPELLTYGRLGQMLEADLAEEFDGDALPGASPWSRRGPVDLP